MKPYFSPDDTEKGSRWSTTIAEALNSSTIGFICLTKDNIHNDWILFETGALSKVLNTSYVCPLLFDLKNSDITGPLNQFQSTSFNKTDYKKLIKSVNERLENNKLPEKILNRAFETYWPDFEDKIKGILNSQSIPSADTPPKRTTEDILEEILSLTRENNRIYTRNLRFVPDVALKELAASFLEIAEQQKNKQGDYQDALNVLLRMSMPLSYILARHSSKSDEMNKLFREVRQFNFVEDLHLNEKNTIHDNPDDEIPF